MTSRAQRVLSLAAFLILLPGRLPAEEDAAAAIERREEELNTALTKCDAASLDRLWDDEMTFVFPNGRLATKPERLAGLKRCTPGSPTSETESVKTKVYGDVAVAIVSSKWTGTNDGRPIASRFRATHIWARRAGYWVLVSAHVSQVKE
jgi:ketosteroid isomerase-like protein